MNGWFDVERLDRFEMKIRDAHNGGQILNATILMRRVGCTSIRWNIKE